MQVEHSKSLQQVTEKLFMGHLAFFAVQIFRPDLIPIEYNGYLDQVVRTCITMYVCVPISYKWRDIRILSVQKSVGPQKIMKLS